MRSPKDLKSSILKNPWFLWILVLLGINPLNIIDPTLQSVANQLSVAGTRNF